jgi:tetratricopeptide (TPR) repeat protein
LNNLYGEVDTPIEIYNWYKKMDTSNDYDKLLDEIEDLCNKYDRAECYALKGDLYKRMLKIEYAFENYKKAIDKNPNNAAYYFILGQEYLWEGMFYDALDTLSFLIEHKNLLNYTYFYVSSRAFRLIAACCIGDWDIAQEDIEHLPDDYVVYIRPVEGRITTKRLLEAIENKRKLV